MAMPERTIITRKYHKAREVRFDDNWYTLIEETYAGGHGYKKTCHLIGDCPLKELNSSNRNQSDSGDIEHPRGCIDKIGKL